MELRGARPLSPQKSIELRWGCRRWRRFGFRFGTKPLDISKDATTMPILAAREEILPSPEKYSIISHSSLPASGPATKHPHRSTSKIKSWDARLVCSLPHWKETSEYTAYFWVFWINAAHGSLGALIATRRRNTSEISSGDMVSAAVCCCELENGSTQWWLSIVLAKKKSFSQIMCWLLTSFQPRNNNQSHPWPPGPLPVGAANHAGSTTLGDKEPTASKEGWAASWRHSRRTCGRSGWREKLELGYQKGLDSLQVVYWILLNCNVSGGYEFSKRAFAKIASLCW